MGVNKENMVLWVEGLRSGKYSQGRGSLRQVEADGVKHCCLGVACEVALASGGVELTVSTHRGCDSFDGECGVLPPVVRQWLGVEDPDPALFSPDDGIVHCLSANDTLGMTFEQIADGLERYYELSGGESADAGQ